MKIGEKRFAEVKSILCYRLAKVIRCSHCTYSEAHTSGLQNRAFSESRGET